MADRITDDTPRDKRVPAMTIADWDKLLLGIAAADRRAPEWRRLRRRRWTRPDSAGAGRNRLQAS